MGSNLYMPHSATRSGPVVFVAMSRFKKAEPPPLEELDPGLARKHPPRPPVRAAVRETDKLIRPHWRRG
jgi:hypothetical protein